MGHHVVCGQKCHTDFTQSSLNMSSEFSKCLTKSSLSDKMTSRPKSGNLEMSSEQFRPSNPFFRWLPMGADVQLDCHGNKMITPWPNSTDGYKRAREGVPNSVDPAHLPTLDTYPCPLITLQMGRFCWFCRPDLPQPGSPRPLPPHNPADGPILPIV